MAGQYGVKETKEVLVLVKAVALAVVAEAKKDGFQPKDVLAFLKTPAFDTALAAAVQGLDQVPLELTDLGIFDGVELGRFAYGVMDEILDALKGVVKK